MRIDRFGEIKPTKKEASRRRRCRSFATFSGVAEQ
jgi:hypothetical protein